MKPNNKTIISYVIDIIIFTAGGMLYSVGINCFTAPNNIAPGGLTGVAIILNYLSPVPIGAAIIILNIPLFLIGLKKIGVRFIVRTIIATIIMSVLIDITALFLPEYTGNVLLACLYGGILTGAGLALVFLRGATTGGTDIIAKLINNRFKFLSMGRIILFIDLIIIAVSAVVFKSVESALFAIIMIFTSSRIIDNALYGADRGKMLFIVTSRPKEISDAIMEVIARGVTVLEGTGAYSKDKRYILMCAVRRQEAAKLHEIIKKSDDRAFVVVTEAGEIVGEGFKGIKG